MPALAGFGGITQGQGVTKMLGYSQEHNTNEKPTSIPFGLPHKPKHTHI